MLRFSDFCLKDHIPIWISLTVLLLIVWRGIHLHYSGSEVCSRHSEVWNTFAIMVKGFAIVFFGDLPMKGCARLTGDMYSIA